MQCTAPGRNRSRSDEDMRESRRLRGVLPEYRLLPKPTSRITTSLRSETRRFKIPRRRPRAGVPANASVLRGPSTETYITKSTVGWRTFNTSLVFTTGLMPRCSTSYTILSTTQHVRASKTTERSLRRRPCFMGIPKSICLRPSLGKS